MWLRASVFKSFATQKKRIVTKTIVPRTAGARQKQRGEGRGGEGNAGREGPGRARGRGEIEFEQKRLPGIGIKGGFQGDNSYMRYPLANIVPIALFNFNFSMFCKDSLTNEKNVQINSLTRRFQARFCFRAQREPFWLSLCATYRKGTKFGVGSMV